MKVSYKWLQTYFEDTMPAPRELAELINAHSFEVESVEDVPNGDTALDIKVMPDRAHYALCHKGIAREVRAIGRYTLKMPEKIVVDSSPVSEVNVSIEAKEYCSRYMARRVENINIGMSSPVLKERLEAIGARSINNVVDATNYVMFDMGQPLHAFDADKVKGNIVVRLAHKGEKIELLPESINVGGNIVLKDRLVDLTETDLVIADDIGPLAIAGVKGGRRAEISPSTKNIILEVANFHPVYVRRTANRLNLRNESSRRFENEIIPEIAEEAMQNVCGIIKESNPTASFSAVTDIFLKKTEKRTVVVKASFVEEKLGVTINEREIKEIIEITGSEIIGRDGEMIVVPPLDRLDLSIPEDFVDEVARIKGYETMISKLPDDLLSPIPVEKSFYYAEKIKNILVDCGYSEVLLYSLVEKGAFTIEHPLASDKSALRENISESMVRSMNINTQNSDLLGLEVLKVFELGKVFPKSGEKKSLCLGVNMTKKKKGVSSESIIKETIEKIETELSIKLMGELSKVGSYALYECDFDKVISDKDSNVHVKDLSFKPLPRDKKYIPFSIYPYIVRDVAVFVPEIVTDVEVWTIIESALEKKGTKNLIARHTLFDVFKKDSKISYGYRLIFQSMERTLTDTEISQSMECIYGLLKEKGWEVR